MSTRREFIGQSSAALAGAALLSVGSSWASLARAAASATTGGGSMLKRVIPSSGEAVPAIGMGTSGSFEVTPGGGGPSMKR